MTARQVGPLSGVRVLELSGIGPGPFAAGLLGDLGADVVRIDRPVGDAPIPEHLDVLRRSRRSVALDLREAAGVEAFLGLASQADVVIECYRPGVAERLGIGPEECRRINPRLVYARMTGWGQSGPLATTAGHDITYIALTGALHALGRTGQRPPVPLNLIGDFAGGALYLVAGVLAALLERENSGLGQEVDAAIVDGTTHMLGMFHGMLTAGQWRDERGVNLLDGGVPWYDTYETKCGGFVAVGALEPQFYSELMQMLGLDADVKRREDIHRWHEIREELAAAFKARTRDEWTTTFGQTDACVAPVLSIGESIEHPHMRARANFIAGRNGVQPSVAPRLSRTPGQVVLPPALRGEHTDEVLADWCGSGMT